MHLNAEAIEIKPGVKVLPMKQVGREKWVELTRVPADLSNESIIEILSRFGKVASQPEFMTMQIRPNEEKNHYAALMSNIISTDRRVLMIVEINIPSFILIEGNRIKTWYEGQLFHSHCLQRSKDCPGGGKAEECVKKETWLSSGMTS